MKLSFRKMHGAGNDFVMIDGRDLPRRALSRSSITGLCDRRRGIGADGLIVVALSSEADFAMTYWNADGGEAAMCGNGARCAIALARDLGLAGDECRFETGAGLHHGSWRDGLPEILLPPFSSLDLVANGSGSGEIPEPVISFVDTGVPHLVIVVDDVRAVVVADDGPLLASSPWAGPDRANVNWVERGERGGSHAMRTWERGVDAETLACGTGACACAVVLEKRKIAPGPVTLLTRGGDPLTVTMVAREATDGSAAMRLRGPAVTAYSGEVDLDDE